MPGRVLIVDGEPEVVTSLRAVLESEGYDVSQSASGDPAATALQVLRPHVVLLDPPLRDSETLDYVRAHHPAVPIVVISEDIQREAARRTRAAGTVEGPGRPFDFSLLRRLVAHSMTLATWQ